MLFQLLVQLGTKLYSANICFSLAWICSQKHKLVYLNKRLWNNMCIWQLQSNHCRYPATLCSIKPQTPQTKKTILVTFSNMLCWYSRLWLTEQLTLFFFCDCQTKRGSRCAHTLTHLPASSSLHRWTNKPQISARQKRKKQLSQYSQPMAAIQCVWQLLQMTLHKRCLR